MKHMFVKALYYAMGAALIGGCAGTKITIPSYSEPYEAKKVEEIRSGGDMEEGEYLALAINPDIAGKAGKDKKTVDQALIEGVKEGLTDTNFITLYPIYDLAYVSLNMKILSYEFKQPDANSIDADIQVSFTIIKGENELMSKTYGASKHAHASDATMLASHNEIIVKLCQEVTDEFIADISPRKTFQVRELKSMPADLEYVITYAKQGNYETAVSDMQKYGGEKGADFYYNLAVFYEALSGKTENMDYFKKAEKAYTESFKHGGYDDETITKAKARFDNFYRLFKKVKAQSEVNEESDSAFGDI